MSGARGLLPWSMGFERADLGHSTRLPPKKFFASRCRIVTCGLKATVTA
jgi:hypothetical protein